MWKLICDKTKSICIMIHFKGLQISFVWHKFAALIYTSAQKHSNYSLQICIISKHLNQRNQSINAINLPRNSVISKHLNQRNQSINAINLPRNSQLWVDRVQPFLLCAVQSCLKWRRCQKCYIVDVGWWCCRTGVSSVFLMEWMHNFISA